MYTRVRLLNYRSHGDTEVSLKPLTVLVGPVASGKSNLFKGLLLLQNSVHWSFVELFPPGLGQFDLVRSRWAEETAPIAFEVDVDGLPSFPNDRARYSLKLVDSPYGVYVLQESLERQSSDEPWQWVFQRTQKKQVVGEYGAVDPYEPTLFHRIWHADSRVKLTLPGPQFAKEVAQAVSSFGYYHLDASTLKTLGTGQEWERIGYNGERLPDFLAWAKSTPEGAPVYERILDQMRELLPGLDSIIVTQVRTERQGIAMSFKGYHGYLAAPDLSDGTLLTLGLLCVMHGPLRPKLLCIEEPETGLHPRRLRWLFDRFLELAYPPAGQQAVQVVLSTHSPYLVDFFSEMPDHVQVVTQTDGQTTISPLNKIVTEQFHEPVVSGEPVGRLWATGLYEGL